MIDKITEFPEMIEAIDENGSERELIQGQLNDAILLGDEKLIRYYRNQLVKLQALSQNEGDTEGGKDIKLGGGLSSYQVYKGSAEYARSTAQSKRNQASRETDSLKASSLLSEAEALERDAENMMKKYEAGVAREKAETERIKAQAEKS